jgi:putative membrane protein
MQSEEHQQDVVRFGAGPHRTSALTLLLGAGGTGVGLVLLLITRESPIGIVIAAFGFFRLVGWFFLTYELTPNELVIRSGVLQRRTQVVPYQRVQQIDFRRGLTAQIFGLTEMRIETAGSAEGRVNLAYLDQNVGDHLRAHILERRAHAAGERPKESAPGSEVPPEPPRPPERLVTMSSTALVRAGLTSDLNVIVVCVAFVVWPVLFVSAFADGNVISGWGGSLLGLPFLVAALLAVVTIRHCLTFSGLALDVVGEDLRIEYGLLERQHLTLPRARVQHVSISDNLLRRRLGLATVAFHSAATPGVQNASRLLVDGIPRDLADDLLASALPNLGWAADVTLERRTAPAARRGMFRRVAALLAVGVIPAIAFFPAGVAALGVGAIGVPWGRSAHRRAGHLLDARFVAFEAGTVTHRRDVVPRSRIQSVRVQSSWFQRRVGLATLIVDVVGRAPQLYDADVDTARAIAADLTA